MNISSTSRLIPDNSNNVRAHSTMRVIVYPVTFSAWYRANTFASCSHHSNPLAPLVAWLPPPHVALFVVLVNVTDEHVNEYPRLTRLAS